MNLDDKSLFLDAMEDVQPLKRATDVTGIQRVTQRAPQRIDTRQLDNFLIHWISRHHPAKSAAGVSAGRVATWGAG